MNYYLTIIGMLTLKIGLACDFCGCFMGITPYDNQSSICFLYRYKSYNGYTYTDQKHNLFPQTYTASAINNGTATNSGTAANGNSTALRHSGPAPLTGAPEQLRSQKDYEIYTTAELRAKYFMHKRVELNIIVPFIMNSSRSGDEKQRIQNIGDITLLAAYHVISNVLTEKFQHRLILGAGVKLPTGNYNAQNNNERIDFLLQSGTGSVDYIGYLNYIFAYKKMGVNFNSTYKFNGENRYHEQISNSCTNYLNVFYKFRQEKKLKLFPSVQGYFEHTNGVYTDAMYHSGTRTNTLMAGIGLDVFYKNMSLNTAFQLPVHEQRIENNLAAVGKFMIGLTYSFNQHNYLIKSKQPSNT